MYFLFVHSQLVLVYSSSVSRPDYIKALAVNATNTPSPTSVKYLKSSTISVRKNDKYSDQPLKTLSTIRSDDRTVNLSGVIVKAMEIQQCGSGDYKRNIFIIDDSSTVPFLISVFFKDQCSGDIFSVTYLSVLDSRCWDPPFSFPH